MRVLTRRLLVLFLFFIFAMVVIDSASKLNGTASSQMASTTTPRATPLGGGKGRLALATFHKNQIYTINADGTGLIHLTDILTEPRRLQWSADGTQLAFSTLDAWPEIYVMNADGSDLTRLVRTTSVGGFSWSPDGKRIAYDLYGNSSFFDDLQIYTINTDGTEMTQLTHGPGNHGHPVWSPDGKRIAFQFTKDPIKGSYEIHLINADGTGEISIADGITYSQDLLWSPDGKQLLFNNPLQIYVMKVDGSQRKLIDTPNSNGQPSWSPDSKQILYTSFSANRADNSKIDVMNADGSEQKQLTSDPNSVDGFAAWSLDGQWIAFLSVRPGTNSSCCYDSIDVNVMKADGSERRKLTNELELTWKPVWQP